MKLKCISNATVNTSSCLKPCSGLIVTSFSKSAQNTNLADMYTTFQDYDRYKNLTAFPSGLNGMMYVCMYYHPIPLVLPPEAALTILLTKLLTIM